MILWLVPTVLYSLVALAASRMVTGHLAWNSAKKYHRKKPHGDDWFFCGICGLIVGAVWLPVLILWLSVFSSSRILPKIGAEREAETDSRGTSMSRHEEAIHDALNVLGRPSAEWQRERTNASDGERAMQYEIDEAIYTLRAAVGLPVARQVCKVCQARDSIYWSKSDERDTGGKMWCHDCGMIEPEHEAILEKLPDE